MDELQSLVEEMVEAGVPDHEIGAFIQEYGGDQPQVMQSAQNPPTEQAWEQNKPVRSAIAGFAGDVEEWGQENITRENVAGFARTSLEAGGVVGGGAAGGILAASAGGPGAAPFGAISGAAIMHGITSNIADRIDEALGLSEEITLDESTKRAIEDVASGALMEFGGQSVTQVALTLAKPFVEIFKWIKRNSPAMNKEKVMQKAGDVYRRLGISNPEAIKSVKETKKVLSDLGVKAKPTIAQRTGTYEARALEQSLMAKNPEVAAKAQAGDDVARQEALKTIEKVFKTGKTEEDVIIGVEKELSRLKATAGEATSVAESKTAAVMVGKRPQQTGEDIYSALSTAKKEAKTVVDREYGKIPKGVQLDSWPTTKAINKALTDFKLEGGESNTIPRALIKRIKAASKVTKKNPTGKITFENLRDWSSQIGKDIRDSSSGAQPNLKRVRRLMMIKSGVDDAMEQMLKTGDTAVVEQYAVAKDTFTKYFKAYREKTVGKVLEPGQKVAYSDIPSRFFKTGKMDAADDLVRAVGQGNAKKQIDDFAGFDLVSRALKGNELNTPIARKWLAKNRDVLNKYGLYGKYEKIIKTQGASDTTLANLKTYEKAVADRIIGVDTGKVISSVFSGKGQIRSAQTMKDLLSLPGIKGNTSAINGIKSAFKDFIMKKSGVDVEDTLQLLKRVASKREDIFKSYLPAMRVLYRNEPKKIKALQDYNKFLRILGRNKNVAATIGSPTVEKATGDTSFKSKTIMGTVNNLAQLAAVKMGKGWFYSSLKNLAAGLLNIPKKYSDRQLDKLMVEGMFNPDVAETIMGYAIKFKGKHPLAKDLRHHMMTLNIYSGIKTGKILAEESKEY